MAKSPDYTGTATIYDTEFKEVGELIAYKSPDTNDKSPQIYGQIKIKPEYIGKLETANFALWVNHDTGTKCPRCNAPKKPQYKLCYKCNLLTPTPQEVKQP